MQRAVISVQSVTLHRRDMALWGLLMRPSHMGPLRHAPFLNQRHVFDPEVMKRVMEEDLEDSKNQAIAKAIKGSSAPKPAPSQQQHKKVLKRPASSTASHTPKFKKPKMQSTPTSSVSGKASHTKKDR